jgi:hypothetical protein
MYNGAKKKRRRRRRNEKKEKKKEGKAKQTRVGLEREDPDWPL